MSRDTVYSWSLRRARAQVEAEVRDPKTAEAGAVSRDKVLQDNGCTDVPSSQIQCLCGERSRRGLSESAPSYNYNCFQETASVCASLG